MNNTAKRAKSVAEDSHLIHTLTRETCLRQEQKPEKGLLQITGYIPPQGEEMLNKVKQKRE